MMTAASILEVGFIIRSAAAFHNSSATTRCISSTSGMRQRRVRPFLMSSSCNSLKRKMMNKYQHLLLGRSDSIGRRTSTGTRRSLVTSSPSSSSSSSLSYPIDDGAGQPSLSSSSVYYGGSGGVHDVGGLESLMGQQIDVSDPTLQQWEQETHALLIVLVQHGLLTTDELRRHIESMQYNHYVTRSYYCKWATSIALGLIEREVISYADLDHVLIGGSSDLGEDDDDGVKEPLFRAGQRVRVKSEHSMARWRKPHLRTPGYIFGVSGIVESYEGYFPDPSYKAFRSNMMKMISANEQEELKSESKHQEEQEQKEHLYRVKFSQKDIWPEGDALLSSRNCNNNGIGDTADNYNNDDSCTVEIYESWLLDCNQEDKDATNTTWEMDPKSCIKESTESPTDHHHHHHHHHHEDHSHEHLPRAELEQRAVDLELSSKLCIGTGSIDRREEGTMVVGDRLSSALITLLSRPEHLGSNLQQELRQVIDAMESIKIRADGVTLVVKAWTDPSFEERLLNDAAAAAAELGIVTANATTATKLKVVKSELPTTASKGSGGKPGIHNLIACTLCSCYPLSLLGLSPKWYKSRSYRARAVREPRVMLRDSFGLDLSPTKWTIRVHDSTADLRYIVLPPRPPNTEHWSEEELRKLVTRDTMVGVALPRGISTA